MFNPFVSIARLWRRAVGLAVVSMQLRLTYQLHNPTSAWRQMGLKTNEKLMTFARIPSHISTFEGIERFSVLLFPSHAFG